MEFVRSIISAEEVVHLTKKFERWETADILEWCWKRFGRRAAIGTSFQGAGLVALHKAQEKGYDFPVFTIDTGLLFPETLELKQQLERRYKIQIESVKPEQTVDEQAKEHGMGLWKKNPNLCCTLRKVLPLQRKLSELDVWITGIRRQQSATREKAAILELYQFDVLRNKTILKLNPLAGWTQAEVDTFLGEHEIPTNALQKQGYRSIGCQPCTLPVRDGVDERAGRWTGFEKTECGIHTFMVRK